VTRVANVVLFHSIPDFNPDVAEQMSGRAGEYLSRWGRLCR
jgi:hypothetical protein